MDNNSGSISGPFSAGVSLFSAILAWITMKDVQAIFTIGASCIAMVSGFFAIKYYRKQLKK